MPTVADIAAGLERFAPLDGAATWDNVGLLLGDPATEVQRVLTCLTLTPEVATEAVTSQTQLIVTHHPILFRGTKRLTTATAEGRTVLALARAGVAVYCPHTAFDNTRDGINDRLAAKLGLTAVQPLRFRECARQCKIVVFVPESDLAKVSDAMFAAGAGVIGEYRECSFRLAGTGTFHGSAASNPTLGTKGHREEVSEYRLEVVCPEAAVEPVIASLRGAHSYEEPAFDVYALRPSRGPLGEGRIGHLAGATPLQQLAERARQQLHCGPIQVVGDLGRSISSVAIACGAAGEFLADAASAGADAFLTGEMRFHDYLDAKAHGIALILPGHYATERFAVEELAAQLRDQWSELQVEASQSEVDPVTWV